MVARILWPCLYLAWLMVWFTEAAFNPSTVSICDLGPCKCNRGKLLCDCTSSAKEVVLRNELLESFGFSVISVTNCPHLHMASQALGGLHALQQVSIANVSRFTLEERAFDWSSNTYQRNGLLVNITSCAIPEIPSYCFRGSLRDVLLTNVDVTRVRTFAFTSINHAEKIEFKKVNISEIETQSFKKFGVDFLTFSDSRFGMFPTRTMVDIEVHEELRLDNIRVDRIQTEGLKIHSPRNFRLVASTLKHIERNAFNVHTRGDVSIHDNVITYVEEGAFIGFTVDKRYVQEAGKQDLVFENNTLANLESAALTFNTTGFNPRMDWIMIDQRCSCLSIETWTTDLVFFSSDPTYRTPAPHVSTIMFCLNPKPTNAKDFQRLYCNVTKYSPLVKALVVSGVVVALFVIGLVIYCGYKKKGKRYINVPTSPSAVKPGDSTKPHILVVPDGKTYRETELHVIVEHAEPIISTEYVKERPDRNDNEIL